MVVAVVAPPFVHDSDPLLVSNDTSFSLFSPLPMLLAAGEKNCRSRAGGGAGDAAS
jgi:hypothetical protein